RERRLPQGAEMQIACEPCGARYRIAPERVAAGRALKVRCRRCGELIVVPARGPEEPADETRVEPHRPAAAEVASTDPEDAVTRTEAARAGRLTGERNEASVLFSLAQL